MDASYGFNTFQTSLVQLALSVGAILGTIINPIQDRLYLSSAGRNSKQDGKPVPEARLYFAVPGSLLFTAGLFWYGWSSYPDVPWIVPTLGIGCVGLGIYSIYMATGMSAIQCSEIRADGVVTYLTDAYEKYASSALSAASLGRVSNPKRVTSDAAAMQGLISAERLRSLPALSQSEPLQKLRLPVGRKVRCPAGKLFIADHPVS